MTIKKIISALTAAVMLSTCTVVTAQAAEIVYTVDFFDINEYAPSNVSYYYSGRTYYVEKSQCDKETLQKIGAILPRRITVRTDSDRVCSVAASGNWRLDEESGCWHVDADLSSLPENVYDPEGILELLTIWYNVPDDEVKNEFTISPSEAKAGDTVSFDLSTGHAYAYISEVCRIAPNGDGTYSTKHRFYTSESPTYSEKGAHHVYSTSVTPDDSGEYLSVFDDGYSIYVTGKPQTLTVTNNRLPGDVNGDAMIAVLCTICFSVTSCAGNNSSSNDSTDNPTTQSATSASTEKVTEKSTEIVTEKTTEALTENQTEIETEPEMLDYTAVELAGKSLNEIIDIMGGNYEANHLQLSNAFSSDGCPYIYNENKLPGFAFVAQEGDSNYSGISVMNGAKLNENISSDMTYSQIADIVGDMDGFLAGQEGNIMCRNTVDEYNVTFCFIENSYIRENSDGAQLSGDLLRAGNPELQSIGLRMN